MFLRNKKAILVALLFIFGISTQVSAQGLTIKIGGGYNFPLATMGFGSDVTTESSTDASFKTTTTRTEEIVYMSLGKSINFGARIGYMFSENVGADLGIDYALGMSTKNTITNKSTSSFTSSNSERVESISGNRFLLTPSLVVSAGDKTLSPYARLGLGIGLTTCVLEETSNSSSVTAGLTSTSTSEETTELTNKIGLGFAGAVGVDFKVSDMLGFYGEFNVITLNVKAESSEITKSMVNGKDMLPSMDILDKKVTYLDSKTTTETTGDPRPAPSGEVVTARILPFSSFGINVGLKLSF